MASRNSILHSQAEDAVIISGPVVAERVGMAFFDVVKGKGLLSMSVVDGINDRDMSDSDS